jgi:hypothetical protein
VREQKVPRLLVQGGEEKGREIPLTEKTLTMGRLEDNSIMVEDRLASRRHAMLERQHGQYAIRDVGSRNGTFVNGERISEPLVLRDGDEIQIGLEFKALYIDPEATGALVTDAIVRGRGLWLDEEKREVWVQGSRLVPYCTSSRAESTRAMRSLQQCGRTMPVRGCRTKRSMRSWEGCGGASLTWTRPTSTLSR